MRKHANDKWSFLKWAINAQANNLVVLINIKRDQPFKVNSLWPNLSYPAICYIFPITFYSSKFGPIDY